MFRNLYLATLLICVSAGGYGPLAAEESKQEEWFQSSKTVAEYRPKGPTKCFRQFNIDWSWIARRVDQIPAFLSQADPAAFADFCQSINADGTIVMAVPHHGYCSYETKLGQKFPGMKGDWFGATIEQLHRRKIAAFGYVTLNWNWKFMRENLGKDFIHGKPDAEGLFPQSALICLNAPGYLDLVEGYTQEILERYPVDGMRWDILMTPRGCTCEGCRVYYRELYGEQLPDWRGIGQRRQMDFYVATTNRAVHRLTSLCRQIKPSVEIWQNHIQSYTPNDINLGRRMDLAYNEYGDPFRLLLLRGVLNKVAAVNGLMNRTSTEPPVALDHGQWRLCLALDGRCYSYYGHMLTDPRTLLPGPAMLPWHREHLAPFYQTVSRIQPYLEQAEPVAHVGVVFSEATRYRHPQYDRQWYIAPMEALTNAYLARSAPLEFVNCLDLADSARLSRLKLLLVPLSSGLEPDQLEALRRYVQQGGKLLIAGDALRHDCSGAPLSDFALAGEMGVSYRDSVVAEGVLPVSDRSAPDAAPKPSEIHNLMRVQTTSGQTRWSVPWQDDSFPLLHVSRLGKGTIAYLASLDSLELTQKAIDSLAGPVPVRIDGPADKHVVLTRQPQQRRWILHLISEGEYTVQIHGDFAPLRRVVAAHPQENWSWQAEPAAAGMRIHVAGPAGDRLLVLE